MQSNPQPKSEKTDQPEAKRRIGWRLALVLLSAVTIAGVCVVIALQDDWKTIIELGSCKVLSTRLRAVAISQRDDFGLIEDVLAVERVGDELLVTAKVFDKQGSLVFQIEGNDQRINKAGYALLRPTNNRVIVNDNKGNKILDVEYVDDRTIKVLENYYLRRGVPVIITPQRMTAGTWSYEHVEFRGLHGILVP